MSYGEAITVHYGTSVVNNVVADVEVSPLHGVRQYTVQVEAELEHQAIDRFKATSCSALSHELIQCVSVTGRGFDHFLQVDVVGRTSYCAQLVCETNQTKAKDRHTTAKRTLSLLDSNATAATREALQNAVDEAETAMNAALSVVCEESVTIQYKPPTLISVGGPGARLADTRGKQALILKGKDFGPVGSLVAPSSTALSLAGCQIRTRTATTMLPAGANPGGRASRPTTA
jgi:hypothetical protein